MAQDRQGRHKGHCRIRRGIYRSVAALRADIRSFLEQHNADPKPFKRTKSADHILASIERFCLRNTPPGHVALFALILGDATRAWQIYEAQVHPGGAWGPALNVATDAPAFLWRAELAGQARRVPLWREVRDYALKAFPKAGIAFVDVHRALACVATDDRDGLAGIVAELEQRTASGRSPAGDVVQRLIAGLTAYGRGDWAAAIVGLEPALAETVRIGGSRAQRDLVENTLLAAYLRDGRAADARRLIATHADRRPSVPVAGLA